MILKQAVQKIRLLTEDNPDEVEFGSFEWNRLAAYADSGQQSWANEGGVQWRSLRRIGEFTLTTSNAYPLDTENRNISYNYFDEVEIDYNDNTDQRGNTVNNGDIRTAVFRIVSPDYLRSQKQSTDCTFYDGTLFFAQPFRQQDPIVGGQVRYAYYTLPQPIDSSTPEDYIH